MTVSNEDLLTRIEELRQGLDALGRSVTSLRTDDMDRAFQEQICASYLENNRNALRSTLESWNGEMPSPQVLKDLADIYDDAMERYAVGDLDGAMRALEEVRELVSRFPGEGTEGGPRDSILSALDRSRQQMAVLETMRYHTGRPRLRRSCESAYSGIEPERLEAMIVPLSNAIRLKVLALLYTSSRSFTEMGQELQLQKGHLQFHVRKLLEAGYIQVDRRTHLYSIGEKGLLAVDGLGQLFSRL